MFTVIFHGFIFKIHLSEDQNGITVVILYLGRFLIVHFWFSQSYQDDEEGVPFDGTASSFPKDYGYGPFDADQDVVSSSGDQKPRILLMGLRR